MHASSSALAPETREKPRRRRARRTIADPSARAPAGSLLPSRSIPRVPRSYPAARGYAKAPGRRRAPRRCIVLVRCCCPVARRSVFPEPAAHRLHPYFDLQVLWKGSPSRRFHHDPKRSRAHIGMGPKRNDVRADVPVHDDGERRPVVRPAGEAMATSSQNPAM